VKPDRSAKYKSAKQFNAFLVPPVRFGRVPAQLTDHGAVHDKPDDKLVLFEYESFTRNMAVNNAILLCAGRVRSKSREEQPAARLIAATPKKQTEATGLQLDKFKAGHWPCFIFW
jgi:hypothetical protein